MVPFPIPLSIRSLLDLLTLLPLGLGSSPPFFYYPLFASLFPLFLFFCISPILFGYLSLLCLSFILFHVYVFALSPHPAVGSGCTLLGCFLE